MEKSRNAQSVHSLCLFFTSKAKAGGNASLANGCTAICDHGLLGSKWMNMATCSQRSIAEKEQFIAFSAHMDTVNSFHPYRTMTEKGTKKFQRHLRR